MSWLKRPVRTVGASNGFCGSPAARYLDEIQRVPDLFPILRVLADRRPLPARFLILCSASPELLRQSSETLAGRLETIVMSGFGLDELGEAHMPRHWLRGGWRAQFIRTFLERHVPQMGIRTPASAPSTRIALEDLSLNHLTVIYPGTRAYRATERIQVLPAAIIATGNRRSLLAHTRR